MVCYLQVNLPSFFLGLLVFGVSVTFFFLFPFLFHRFRCIAVFLNITQGRYFFSLLFIDFSSIFNSIDDT